MVISISNIKALNREAREISEFSLSKKSTVGATSEVKCNSGNMESSKIF